MWASSDHTLGPNLLRGNPYITDEALHRQTAASACHVQLPPRTFALLFEARWEGFAEKATSSQRGTIIRYIKTSANDRIHRRQRVYFRSRGNPNLSSNPSQTECRWASHSCEMLAREVIFTNQCFQVGHVSWIINCPGTVSASFVYTHIASHFELINCHDQASAHCAARQGP